MTIRRVVHQTLATSIVIKDGLCVVSSYFIQISNSRSKSFVSVLTSLLGQVRICTRCSSGVWHQGQLSFCRCLRRFITIPPVAVSEPFFLKREVSPFVALFCNTWPSHEFMQCLCIYFPFGGGEVHHCIMVDCIAG